MNTIKIAGIYVLIKDNLSVIVLLPALLGGIWQVMELLCIGPSYIRFFSVTQLIPDGLLILSIFLLILFVNLVVIRFPKWLADTDLGMKELAGNNKESCEKEYLKGDNIVYDKKEMKNIICAFSIGVIGFSHYLWVNVLYPAFKSQRIGLGGIMEVTMVCPIILIKLKFIYRWIKVYLSKTAELILYLLFCLSFSVLITLFFFCLKVFHNSFLLPGNFKNIANIKENPLVKTTPTRIPEIVYFNDKYIFIKIKEGRGSDSIEVRKFEEFLQNPKPKL
ncbi:hypothetical protein [Chitinophaga sp. HK235]|uniref:hypothetical protein n=1 Tax=Chitinophaga sp. HK235 TaxID=2952571 RepID=UPI001BAA48E5|nr:hypothetical protein [Chitinophaga sp. HK235]